MWVTCITLIKVKHREACKYIISNFPNKKQNENKRFEDWYGDLVNNQKVNLILSYPRASEDFNERYIAGVPNQVDISIRN